MKLEFSEEGMELEQDLAFQRRQWRFHPWVWGLMLGFVLAGLLGLFGHGALSRRTSENRAFRLEYDAFLRRDAPSDLVIELQRDEAAPSLRLEQDYVRAFEIQSLQPTPISVTERAGVYIARFLALERGARIELSLRPRGVGQITARVRLGTDEALEVRQFIYP